MTELNSYDYGSWKIENGSASKVHDAPYSSRSRIDVHAHNNGLFIEIVTGEGDDITYCDAYIPKGVISRLLSRQEDT